MNASVKLIELVLPATVSLKAVVPEEHVSARMLGTERFGSGVVVDPAGLILTVNYVVMGARGVEVTLLDNTTVEASVVAQDYASGIAVLDMGVPRLAALQPGSSADLRLGQDVFIAAATGGNQRRASDGAVTWLGPYDASWEYSLERAIKTTAMNPGLGGAPLLDTLGRVVGVVSLDLGEVGHFSLAIPVEQYSGHRDELLRCGRRVSRPSRAWIGLYCYTVRDHVVIAGLLPGAPGEAAGLRSGDVVLAVDDRDVSGRHDLYAYLWSQAPGAVIRFRVFRNSAVQQVAVPSGNAEDFFA
ncbi:MAG: S1C family serine protease [Candidatus Binatia bacterium]